MINSNTEISFDINDKDKRGLASYKSIFNDYPPSYVIARIENSGNIHAEMKQLSFILAFTSFTSLTTHQPIYIGISILCCHDCRLVIESFNKALGSTLIQIRGYHDIKCDKWDKPFFLTTSFQDLCPKENINFIKKIQSTYSAKMKEHKEQHCSLPRVNQQAISPIKKQRFIPSIRKIMV